MTFFNPAKIAKILMSRSQAAPESVEQSIELERIDAHGRSTASHMGDRINQDIENGVYGCPICHDTIGPDAQELWDCRCCYQAYHPHCISTWAKASTNAPRDVPWLCPTCKYSHTSFPQAGCWCRNPTAETLPITAGSCGRSCSKENLCGTRRHCVEYTCPSTCHPGPCIPKDCTAKCGEERPAAADPSIENDVFDTPRPVPPANSRIFPPLNNRYVPPGYPTVTINNADADNDTLTSFYRDTGHQQRRLIGTVNPNVTSKALMRDVLILFSILLFIDCFAIIWMISRIRRFTLPLQYQSFTESRFRYSEQAFCMATSIALLLINAMVWGSILLRLHFCFRKKLGLNPSFTRMTPVFPWRDFKIVLSRVLFFFYWLIFFVLVFLIPAGLCFGPGFFWKYQMQGTCVGFDTRIKLHTPYSDYFGLENMTIPQQQFIAPQYTQTPGRYSYPSIEDYESYKFGIDLFNITKVNSSYPLSSSSYSTREPFEEHWRIMGIYGGKPLHMDFDLLHHTWRISEGSIVTSSETANASFYFHRGMYAKNSIPNFQTAIQNLTQVRSGTWTRTDRQNPHTSFPELGLQMPHWDLFERHCVYQSFMRVFKEGVGEQRLGAQEIGERRGREWMAWGTKSRREEVLRTMSYGYGGRDGLEVCARRSEYMWDSNGGEEREEGLGDDLLVPLGLMAVVRKSMREEEGSLLHGCAWPEN
ncbi:FKBP12-associated protein [Ciborinia camelliae]|nr:FKBP12-associated protein [Ciborinia camelliae]